MKAIVVTSNDWHLAEENLGEIPGLISQQIDLAKKKGTKNLVCIGDVFQSRKAQKESVLNCFGKILDMIHEAGMVLYTIPGNHDKTDYSSYSSFLDPFSSHPALKLMTDFTNVNLGGVSCSFIPFFEEEMWVKIFESNELLSTQVLFSHIAVNGSINNNKTKVESTITPKMFKGMEVFLGHYHNYQDVAPNIHHLPSIKQNNFGEDVNKGFTVLYDNLSYEIVNSEFKKYLNFDVNIRDPKFKEIMTNYTKTVIDNFVKVKIWGSKSEIKSVDLDLYKAAGIKVETIIDELTLQGSVKVDLSNSNAILEHFEKFCSERDIPYEEGEVYLKQAING